MRDVFRVSKIARKTAKKTFLAQKTKRPTKIKNRGIYAGSWPQEPISKKERGIYARKRRWF